MPTLQFKARFFLQLALIRSKMSKSKLRVWESFLLKPNEPAPMAAGEEGGRSAPTPHLVGITRSSLSESRSAAATCLSSRTCLVATGGEGGRYPLGLVGITPSSPPEEKEADPSLSSRGYHSPSSPQKVNLSSLGCSSSGDGEGS